MLRLAFEHARCNPKANLTHCQALENNERGIFVISVTHPPPDPTIAHTAFRIAPCAVLGLHGQFFLGHLAIEMAERGRLRGLVRNRGCPWAFLTLGAFPSFCTPADPACPTPDMLPDMLPVFLPALPTERPTMPHLMGAPWGGTGRPWPGLLSSIHSPL